MGEQGSSAGELVLRARRGDSAAWDDLVRQLGSRVWAVVRSYGLGKADAEDVFQLTWMRLVTHLDTLREPDRVAAWLAVTARHESYRLMRRKGRQVPSSDDQDFEGADPLEPSNDARLLATERQQAVWDAVALVPPHCQRLLRLLMADPPFTYEQITEILDMPQGSIGPTRSRCLEKLRRHLVAMDEASSGLTS